ncbi:hypothetical protein BD626DRAFT_501537 [Schizophyllum amplum]|uniref:F-box domain-containing protein n=1 Tax=Schizophyllum amplum TaxID=97359 RepID=A0A550C9W3_9AGAR|nr:hypothetical protein BD626DRAFT_501537 [Auriculariopsis ampla]
MAHLSPLPGEIIERICTDWSLGKRDLCRLARVSKERLAWKEFQTDNVRQIVMLRPLTEEDWVPVYKRSGLVKTVYFNESGWLPAMLWQCPPQVLDTITRYRPDLTGSYVKLLDLLLSPNLSLPRVDFASYSGMQMQALIQSFGRWTSLKSTDQITLPFASSEFPSLLSLGLYNISGRLQCLRVGQLWHLSQEDLASIFQAVHDHTAHDMLKELRVEGYHGLSQPRPTLQYRDLLPLGVFFNVTHVHLNATVGVQLTDNEHAKVALWWPNVEVLEYDARSISTGMATPATLQSLAHYAQCCPKLRQLSIPLTTLTENIPGPISNSMSVGLRGHPMCILNVGGSQLDDENVERVARYLLGVFPSLARVRCGGSSLNMEAWSLVMHTMLAH